MKSKFNNYCLLGLILVSSLSFSQEDTSVWRALFAVGLNSPSQDGLIEPFETKSTNFPTINLGIQHMFKQQFGARLDFGYNRFSNTDNTPDFKVNYTRINAQFVYDTSRLMSFLSPELGLILHAGPGYTSIKPLDLFRENKNSYLNVMAGIEFNYSISRTVSLLVDGSYIKGFSSDFDPITDGAGSFNGDMLTITFGASVSLINCRTCN
ncbi:outer membrane beta-barrel protein [Lacinutrix sp.]|uniref:outer membrane beta-barrel protein n=1 Tax=Lacinutrix sp. TaxID=1937692 RepID=UPI0025C12E42|nr:outer membrane beta-barrel protein [Lacinutrix sp.]